MIYASYSNSTLDHRASDRLFSRHRIVEYLYGTYVWAKKAQVRIQRDSTERYFQLWFWNRGNCPFSGSIKPLSDGVILYLLGLTWWEAFIIERRISRFPVTVTVSLVTWAVATRPWKFQVGTWNRRNAIGNRRSTLIIYQDIVSRALSLTVA